MRTDKVTARLCPRIAGWKALLIVEPGVDGEQFGINFALAMPKGWNGDFLMQGEGVRMEWCFRRWDKPRQDKSPR